VLILSDWLGSCRLVLFPHTTHMENALSMMGQPKNRRQRAPRSRPAYRSRQWRSAAGVLLVAVMD
jgi:hypothetical protein